MFNPVLLFCYKRLDALKCTVTALQNNIGAEDTELFIFSDGPKSIADGIAINEVRNYVYEIRGFKKVHIHASTGNKGLATSIIEGVTLVLKKYPAAIVLEDDLVTTPNFLQFMQHSLEFYKNEQSVFSISGYNYNFQIPANYHYDTYLASRGCSWGWATWSNRWFTNEWDINKFAEVSDSKFKDSFNYSGSDLYSMLMKQQNGSIDSWAIRWYFNQWRQKGLTVYPALSLIDNNGFDDFATHTNVYNRYKTVFMPPGKQEFKFHPGGEINKYYQKKIQSKFSLTQRAIWGRCMTYLKKANLV